MKPVESVSLKTSVASQQRDKNNSLHTERAPQVAVSLPLSFRADCGLATLPGRAGSCWTLTVVGWRRDILIRLFPATSALSAEGKSVQSWAVVCEMFPIYVLQVWQGSKMPDFGGQHTDAWRSINTFSRSSMEWLFLLSKTKFELMLK